MLLSWLRPCREQNKRPRSFRPMLESLDERIVPTNAHFIYANSSLTTAGAVAVSFKEAGLGDNQNIDYALTGDQTVNVTSINNGGNVVHGQPWSAIDTTLATGTFSSGKNGQVTATLTSQVPSPSDLGIKVPNGNGWHQTLDVSYTNLVLTDTTNNVSTSVPSVSGSVAL